MKFTIRFLSKTLAEAAPEYQESIALQTIDSTDPTLLAALPVRGDTVMLPYRENSSEPTGLGTFVVEGRAFTYLAGQVQVDVVVGHTGMFPLPEATS